MTLKNSFKWLTEGLKNRLWVIALIGLGFFFTYPVAVSMMGRQLRDNGNTRHYINSITTWLSFANPLVVFWVIVFSVVAGMGSFGYINSRSRVDFYHSLPIRRDKLYLNNYTVGILVFAIPYALMLILGTAVAGMYGVSLAGIWRTAMSGLLLNLIYYILMYTVVIIAVMMTGNRVIAYLGVLVFNFIVPVTALIVGSYFEVFFITSYRGFMDGLDWTRRFSPYLEYLRQAGNYDGSFKSLGGALWGAVLIAAGLGVLGCLLYRKRPSEAAGKAMAFAITKPVVRIIIVMDSALLFALTMCTIQESIGWAVFGILCGGIIAHCVIEIIYHFEFKKLFSHKLQLIGCLLAAFLFFCVFRFDWLGYDSYLPKPAQLSSAAVDVSLMNDWTSYGCVKQHNDGSYYWQSEAGQDYIWDHMQGVDMEPILRLAEKGVEKARAERDGWHSYQTGNQITICYTLKNGRQVCRCYGLSYEEMREALLALCAQPAYKAGIYPVMKLDNTAVAQIRYREYEPEIRLDELTDLEIENLLTAYQHELGQMTLEQMEHESPVGLIRFVTAAEMPALLYAENEAGQSREYYFNDDFAERNFYPVYSSFTDTCRLLGQYGINPGDDLRQYQTESYHGIREMTREAWAGDTWEAEAEGEAEYVWESEYDYKEDAELQEYVIDEKKQIEILDSLVSLSSLTYYNSISRSEMMELTADKWISGKLEEINVVLAKDKIPEFLTILPDDDGGQQKEETGDE